MRVFMIFNKIVLVGIGAWVVWALQALILNPELQHHFPFTRSVFLRVALVLIGIAVVMDFFAIYTPSASEIILNAGMLGLKGFIFYAYKTGKLWEENGRIKSKF